MRKQRNLSDCFFFFFFYQSVYTSKSWNNLVNFTYLNGFKKGLQLIFTYQTSDTQWQRKNNVRGVTGGDEPTSWVCKSSRLYSSFSATCYFASWCHTKRANIGLKGTVHPKHETPVIIYSSPGWLEIWNFLCFNAQNKHFWNFTAEHSCIIPLNKQMGTCFKMSKNENDRKET